MTEEIWKSVNEVKYKLNLEMEEGKDYQISNRGNYRIVSVDGKIEPGHITISESQATITVGKKQVLFHRLVALLFLENDDPQTNTVVIYKDGDHRNNDVRNLAWVSVSERNERRYINQTSTKNIRCIDEDKIFASATSASLYYGIPIDLIKNSIKKNSICFGHRFEYPKENLAGKVLYLSARKAKSLSSMLKDMKELREHFDEVHVNIAVEG